MKGIMFEAKAGVTLVELLVALAIVAILAVVAIPFLGHYLDMRRIEGAAQAIHADVILARQHAISEQAPVTLVFQSGANWCTGITTASTCNCTNAGSCNLGQTLGASYGDVNLSLSGFSSGSQAIFSSSRGVLSTAGTVTLAIGSNSVNVELNQMGVPRLCSANGVGGFSAC